MMLQSKDIDGKWELFEIIFEILIKSLNFSVITNSSYITPQPNRSKVFGLNCGSNPYGDLL